MIKGRRLPAGSLVAHLALLRHARRGMVGIGGGLVVLQVASDASGRGQIKISIGMALVALQLGMSAGKRKSDGVMIEVRRLPRAGGMALLASLGKSQGHMIGIASLLKVGKMAADARRRGALILSTHVTSGAIQSGVHSGQSKAGYPQMIELGAQPGIDGVALLTLDRKVGSNVVGNGGLSKAALVTGIALDRQSLELPNSSAFVAVGAIEPGMASD
jgi:hypothetical protein